MGAPFGAPILFEYCKVESSNYLGKKELFFAYCLS